MKTKIGKQWKIEGEATPSECCKIISCAPARKIVEERLSGKPRVEIERVTEIVKKLERMAYEINKSAKNHETIFIPPSSFAGTAIWLSDPEILVQDAKKRAGITEVTIRETLKKLKLLGNGYAAAKEARLRFLGMEPTGISIRKNSSFDVVWNYFKSRPGKVVTNGELRFLGKDGTISTAIYFLTKRGYIERLERGKYIMRSKQDFKTETEPGNL